jgi:hypothetical protein
MAVSKSMQLMEWHTSAMAQQAQESFQSSLLEAAEPAQTVVFSSQIASALLHMHVMELPAVAVVMVVMD